MKAPASDEKSVMVMLYTQNSLVRGEVIVKAGQRMNIWLRTQGVPMYIPVQKPQMISFGGGAARTITYPEILIPLVQVCGFHLAAPAEEPLDYEQGEALRTMREADILLGSFLIKGQIRTSTQLDVAASLEVMRSPWLSVYDAGITNPYLPQFNLKVPMLLVNPAQITFGLS